ncbi:MAG: GPW/gp25 family protein [Oscillospiraceae bacterium]|nr:GPW/gp25 family protein [Oscillospiraceae bacterium]
MRYRVSAEDAKGIHLNETDTVLSVLQNIALILATPKGSVPMYREFGLEQDFLDLPEPAARVRMIAPIREAIERWEPRASVKQITFTHTEGKMVPHVEVEILE